MDIKKNRTALAYTIAPTLFICILIIAYFFQPQIHYAYLANWALVAIILIMILSPFGSRRLSATPTEKPRYPIVNWLFHIIALQACLLTVFLGICDVVGRSTTINTPVQNSLFADTLSNYLMHYGLIPWTLFAITAIGMAYQSYVKDRDGYLSEILQPLIKSPPHHVVGLIVNISAKLATQIALATTFVMMILLLANFITNENITLIHGFQPNTLLLTIAIFILCLIPAFKRFLHFMLNGKIPIFASLLMICALFSVVLIVLSVVLQGIKGDTNVPGIIKKMENFNWKTCWIIFATSWWLSWAPIVGAHLGKICRGYSIRTSLIGCLIFPLFISIIAWSLQISDFSVSHHHPTFDLILALIGFTGLLMMMTNSTSLPMLILSYLPAGDLFKSRDHLDFFRRTFIVTAAIIYLYLPAGINLLYLFVFSLTGMAIVFAFLSALMLFQK